MNIIYDMNYLAVSEKYKIHQGDTLRKVLRLFSSRGVFHVDSYGSKIFKEV